MDRVKLLLALLSLLPVLPVARADTPSPALLLERGIFQETALADFEQAIRTYESARRHPQEAPRTAIEATFRLAECHDTLENPLTAWVYYDQVTQAEHAPPALLGLAQEAQMHLVIEIAENNTFYSAELIHYLGDLILGIDGALRQSEADRAQRLLTKTESPLSKLREEARRKSKADRELIGRIQEDTSRLQQWVAQGALDTASAHFVAQPHFAAFVNRQALSSEDEVFGYALEHLDEVIRALNEGKSVVAHQELDALKLYLQPLDPWPADFLQDPDISRYVSQLIKLTEALEKPILRNVLGTARLMVDDFTKIHAKMPMPHWHIDRKTLVAFINPDVLPHYAMATVLLDKMVAALKADDTETAQERLEEAIRRIDDLRKLKAGTSDEPAAQDYHDELSEVSQLLKKGKTDRILSRFEKRSSRHSSR